MKTELVNSLTSTCDASSHPISDHFVDATKMVDLGSVSQRGIDDKPLTSQFVIPDPPFNSPEFEGIGNDGLSRSGQFSIVANSPYLEHLH